METFDSEKIMQIILKHAQGVAEQEGEGGQVSAVQPHDRLGIDLGFDSIDLTSAVCAIDILLGKQPADSIMPSRAAVTRTAAIQAKVQEGMGEEEAEDSEWYIGSPELTVEELIELARKACESTTQ